MNTIKSFIKKILYKTGILSIIHHVKNKDNLTVVMFHRVLDQKDPRYLSANPTYTFETIAFKNCLSFLKRHYNIITLKTLEDYYAKNIPLPNCPLLITFDDGWKDNYDYAYPILKEIDISAVLFVATSILNQTAPFWQEKIYGLYKTNQLTKDDFIFLEAILQEDLNHYLPLSDTNIDLFIEKTFNANLSVTEKIKHYLEEHYPSSDRSFLTTEELSILGQDVFEIGLHGHTHHPLTKVKNVSDELQMSLEILEKVKELNKKFQFQKALSFPHGRYNETVQNECFDQGLIFCFTSDRSKMPLNVKDRIIGRYYLTMDLAYSCTGKFTPHELLLWLM
jgi:peptidoglycan/xylan/chitin deacetylase (PgdA/CDA1 family)